MRSGKRHIKSGEEYDYLFPRAEGKSKTIRKFARLEDTVKLMKKVIRRTLIDTRSLSKLLKAETVKQTCSNIWHFCFNHLQYTHDEAGKEQVRRPARTWRDRKEGVDCDCMSVFIGSILTNLGIPFSIRLTKYQSPEFEHVYPVAQTDNGILILDAVVYEFNREVPYSAKQDITMELQYLNGIDGEDYTAVDDIIDNNYPIDAQGLITFGEDVIEGLEGKAQRQARKAARKAKRAEKKAYSPPLKERLKKGLHVINRVNPATALLRAGVLASMKLNVMHVAGKLRFAYWSDADAQRNNMDMGKFAQLKRLREKLEKIFFGAGGKTENLKKAILSGKGNRDKRVVLNGLGAITHLPNDEESLRSVLGEDLYFDEVSDVNFGVNGLGAVATAAAITSAAGVIGTIAALIKKIGSLFKKGSPQAEQETVQDNTDAQEEKTRKFSLKNLINNIKVGKSNVSPAAASAQLPDTTDFTDPTDAALPAQDPATESTDTSFQRSMDTTDNSANKDASGDPPKTGFVAWVKEHPYITAGIATAVVGGAALAMWLHNKKKKEENLSGVPKKTAKKASQKGKTATTGAKKKQTKSTTAKRPTVKRKPLKPAASRPKKRRSTTKSTRVRKVELL